MGDITLLAWIGFSLLGLFLFTLIIGIAARTWTWESLETQRRFAFKEEENG